MNSRGLALSGQSQSCTRECAVQFYSRSSRRVSVCAGAERQHIWHYGIQCRPEHRSARANRHRVRRLSIGTRQDLASSFLGSATALALRRFRVFGQRAASGLIPLFLASQPLEANCILPPKSAIAATSASWHNNEALADLRHGTAVWRPVKKRPTCVFWQASLCPRATGG